MHDQKKIPHEQQDERLDRILRALERLERRFDEFAGVYLRAKFPFGKPTDRWRRSA